MIDAGKIRLEPAWVPEQAPSPRLETELVVGVGREYSATTVGNRCHQMRSFAGNAERNRNMPPRSSPNTSRKCISVASQTAFPFWVVRSIRLIVLPPALHYPRKVHRMRHSHSRSDSSGISNLAPERHPETIFTLALPAGSLFVVLGFP